MKKMMKKIKQKIAAPIKSQKGIEVKYRRQMNKLGALLIAAVKKEVLEYIKANESSYVADGVGDQLEVIFNRLNAKFTGTAIASFSKTTSQQMVNKVGQSNKAKFDRSIARATGVDLGSVITSEGLEDFVALSVNKNASLIKSLPEEYLKQVETIVNNGVASGARYSTIQKEITAKTGANSKLVNRIKTIARNEVQTINSQITLRRSESLGIKKGIYRTSNDERVRQCHKELDGVEYELKKGAWSKTCGKFIQPGITDINCRCSYSPIIEVQ
jgi:SPP1 gp7 family putative phage head morphogenesis protein